MTTISTPRKILWIVIAVLLAGIIVLRVYYSPDNKKTGLMTIGPVPEFNFVNQDSQNVTRNVFYGKVTVADFIFTTCAGPCPLMSGKMQELQQTFARESHVQLVSFSVDPEYDTPSILTAYSTRFGAIKGKWTFLTGQKQQMYTLIRKGFLLGVEADSTTILHSTKFVLVDADGIIRGYYDSEEDGSIKKLILDIHSLL